VVGDIVAGVGVDEDAARPAVLDKPRVQRAELGGGGHVHFEHWDRVRAERAVEDCVLVGGGLECEWWRNVETYTAKVSNIHFGTRCSPL
jgi:hypothetical protein